MIHYTITHVLYPFIIGTVLCSLALLAYVKWIEKD